jgi:phage gp29-like protein
LLILEEREAEDAFKYLISIGVDISPRHFFENIANPLVNGDEKVTAQYAREEPICETHKMPVKRRKIAKDQSDWLQPRKIKHKVIKSLKRMADPHEQLEYLEFMGIVESHNIIDIDGMVQNGDD